MSIFSLFTVLFLIVYCVCEQNQAANERLLKSKDDNSLISPKKKHLAFKEKNFSTNKLLPIVKWHARIPRSWPELRRPSNKQTPRSKRRTTPRRKRKSTTKRIAKKNTPKISNRDKGAEKRNRFTRVTRKYTWYDVRLRETRPKPLTKCIKKRCRRTTNCQQYRIKGCKYCNYVTRTCSIYRKRAKGQSCSRDAECKSGLSCFNVPRNVEPRMNDQQGSSACRPQVEEAKYDNADRWNGKVHVDEHETTEFTSRLYVRSDDGRELATITIRPKGSSDASVSELDVVQVFQRSAGNKGLGSVLVRDSLKYIREHMPETEKAVLFVSRGDQEMGQVAAHVYQKYGFQWNVKDENERKKTKNFWMSVNIDRSGPAG